MALRRTRRATRRTRARRETWSTSRWRTTRRGRSCVGRERELSPRRVGRSGEERGRRSRRSPRRRARRGRGGRSDDENADLVQCQASVEKFRASSLLVARFARRHFRRARRRPRSRSADGRHGRGQERPRERRRGELRERDARLVQDRHLAPRDGAHHRRGASRPSFVRSFRSIFFAPSVERPPRPSARRPPPSADIASSSSSSRSSSSSTGRSRGSGFPCTCVTRRAPLRPAVVLARRNPRFRFPPSLSDVRPPPARVHRASATCSRTSSGTRTWTSSRTRSRRTSRRSSARCRTSRRTTRSQARSISHWSPYDRVGAVHAVR